MGVEKGDMNDCNNQGRRGAERHLNGGRPNFKRPGIHPKYFQQEEIQISETKLGRCMFDAWKEFPTKIFSQMLVKNGDQSTIAENKTSP